MRYIRRKDNPLILKAFGAVAEGGLGAFDDAVYEEIEGELPEGYTVENKTPLETRLAAIFEMLLQSHKNQVSSQTVKEIIELESMGQRFMRFNLLDEWKQSIENYTPSVAEDAVLIESLKPYLLNEF